jgi:hypothetical protein
VHCSPNAQVLHLTDHLERVSEGFCIVKQITLTQELFALVDDTDYDWLSQWKWVANNMAPKTARGSWYAVSKIDGNPTTMHSLIMGSCKNREIDHIDHNGLNNQRCNLRWCTRSQNQINRGKPQNNTSGFKGVGKHRGRWRATIRKDRVFYHIGLYDTAEAAARAYDKKALEFFGEFAYLNFPIN